VVEGMVQQQPVREAASFAVDAAGISKGFRQLLRRQGIYPNRYFEIGLFSFDL
jgi:hypothetical protein